MKSPETKGERLQVAGAVAPVLRGARPRRVILTGKDGAPVGCADAKDVALSLLARSKIELSVGDDERPSVVFCETCGRPITVGPKAKVPRVCPPRTHLCAAGCGRRVVTKPGTCAAGKTCRACNNAARSSATRRHSDEELARVIQGSASYSVACKALGMSTGPVYRHAQRLGVKPMGQAPR